MAILTMTSELVTEIDLSNIPETIKIYSADIDGRKLSDKWIVPGDADDAITRFVFRSYLINQGYIFD